MHLKQNCKYALVVPTSMGVRLTPAGGQPFGAVGGEALFIHATSAESNVASIAAYLGMPAHVLTAFVKGSPVAAFIKRDLRARGLTFEGPEIDQGGPWGYRHQFNLADSGFGARGPRVHNDRAGEVGRIMNPSMFDLDRLFDRDGVGIVHMSGLFAALSPSTGELCLEIARRAKAAGTAVSFDVNHRASFWKDREEELRKTFTAIASEADILIGNEEDFQLAFGISGPEAGGRNIEEKLSAFAAMTGAIKDAFPKAEVIATTLREVIDVGTHLWGAVLRDFGKGELYKVEPRRISVLDRIGGGDGFVGGLLYGLLRGWESERALQFAWATGAMATTFYTDYAQPSDEEQVWGIWEGNARVKR
ncbi:MAG: PfkB family carbohydrate kinase [Eubacteriales bacterium]|jgi:2-dehydro-3-deoxygluconokinase|nr:sugar kinase [Clostridiales bacterium]